MSNVNQVVLTGNLARDIELRDVGNGRIVGRALLAVGHRTKTGERTDWVRLVLWGRTAEIAGRYLGKGKRVAVVGHLGSEFWESDGKTRLTTEVVVEEIEFLSPKPAGLGRPEGRAGKAAAA